MDFTCENRKRLDCDLYPRALPPLDAICAILCISLRFAELTSSLWRARRFTLVDMQYIDYAWYRVELHLAPSNARDLVGDMKFSVQLSVARPYRQGGRCVRVASNGGKGL